MRLIKEFKGPILFIIKFLVLYLALNLGYGLFVNHYSPNPDPITFFVTQNTELLLNSLGYDTSSVQDITSPNVMLLEKGQAILLVYEGCNGINVFIIFISFILSFSQLKKSMLWFIPLGLLIIHFTNLIRISLLFYVTKQLPDYLYFTHKYLFTAIIYVIVFVCWYVWISKVNKYETQAS